MNADLRYPIGKVTFVPNVSEEQRRGYIDTLAETPARLRDAISGLTEEHLDTPYRPGG